MPDSKPLPPAIYTLRGCKVVFDAELARLYQVSTKAFNQAIRRNAERFPKDFAFQLTDDEVADLRSQFASEGSGSSSLRSQIVTLKTGRRGQHRKYRPFVFTEHGAIMAAMILRSDRAVAMSVYVIRAFLTMREELATNAAILKRLTRIDHHLLEHDVVLRDVYQKLRPLLEPPPLPSKRKIGFHEGNR